MHAIRALDWLIPLFKYYTYNTSSISHSLQPVSNRLRLREITVEKRNKALKDLKMSHNHNIVHHLMLQNTFFVQMCGVMVALKCMFRCIYICSVCYSSIYTCSLQVNNPLCHQLETLPYINMWSSVSTHSNGSSKPDLTGWGLSLWSLHVGFLQS